MGDVLADKDVDEISEEVGEGREGESLEYGGDCSQGHDQPVERSGIRELQEKGN